MQSTNQNVKDIEELSNRVEILERSIFSPLKGKHAIPIFIVESIITFAQ
jgi:hypothetical protein